MYKIFLESRTGFGKDRLLFTHKTADGCLEEKETMTKDEKMFSYIVKDEIILSWSEVRKISNHYKMLKR